MTLDDITLPDLIWLDEFDYNQMAQEQERSLTGGLLLQEGAKQYGRPITLSEGWLTRESVNLLYTLEAQPSEPVLLTLPDGREFYVVLDRTRGPAIEARPVRRYTQAANEPGWQYATTIRLLTVEPPAPEPED
ncbi:MAG: hypothetical protein LAT65_05895 [Saccharospirillum sp.]|nr:hypothetical protein [Saccharospirillum sp.]